MKENKISPAPLPPTPPQHPWHLVNTVVLELLGRWVLFFVLFFFVLVG